MKDDDQLPPTEIARRMQRGPRRPCVLSAPIKTVDHMDCTITCPHQLGRSSALQSLPRPWYRSGATPARFWTRIIQEL